MAIWRLPCDVSQLNWMTRRSPTKGSWPCHELLLRLNASSVPAIGGTSTMMSLILRGSQQAESAARLIPALVHVKKDSDDLGLRIGVDLAVGGTASATHCRDRGSSRQIDPKFVLECLAERIAVEFIKQRLKRWAKY